MPRPPPPVMAERRSAASAVRAHYDGQEDHAIILRRLAEAQREAQEARRKSLIAVKEEFVQTFWGMLRSRHMRRGWDRLKEHWAEAVCRRRATLGVVKLVKRMLNMHLARSWDKWAEMASAEVSTYSVMERAVRTFRPQTSEAWLAGLVCRLH